VTEIEFEQAVVELAHLFGWRVASFRPAQSAKGWRTPVKYDGKGYPDLTLVHPAGHIVFAELKAAKGKPSLEQDNWALLLNGCAIAIEERIDGCERDPSVAYRLWRPANATEIGKLLSFGRVRDWRLVSVTG
jgi:hypothetical protein